MFCAGLFRSSKIGRRMAAGYESTKSSDASENYSTWFFIDSFYLDIMVKLPGESHEAFGKGNDYIHFH